MKNKFLLSYKNRFPFIEKKFVYKEKRFAHTEKKSLLTYTKQTYDK